MKVSRGNPYNAIMAFVVLTLAFGLAGGLTLGLLISSFFLFLYSLSNVWKSSETKKMYLTMTVLFGLIFFSIIGSLYFFAK